MYIIVWEFRLYMFHLFLPPACSCPINEVKFGFGLKGWAVAEFDGKVPVRLRPGNLGPMFPKLPWPRLPILPWGRLGMLLGPTVLMLLCGMIGGGLLRVRLDVKGFELTFWPGTGVTDVVMVLLCGGDFNWNTVYNLITDWLFKQKTVFPTQILTWF